MFKLSENNVITLRQSALMNVYNDEMYINPSVDRVEMFWLNDNDIHIGLSVTDTYHDLVSESNVAYVCEGITPEHFDANGYLITEHPSPFKLKTYKGNTLQQVCSQIEGWVPREWHDMYHIDNAYSPYPMIRY